ncbi:PREDICTED: MLP-like protein 423 [Nelumbo nucifera]|uniref:MLP-like protein 423 n=2 Tax=Nelumbo nucifera TaxID=4432 RepID=A0A1U7ZZ17_NELNU|nr:PREDICTED: MLP-like protein 423 [Nelumbo nucifera]DAD34653.1 TPA_asm: hypothetical protein HUJ06_005293 [Nelumbo nucifera]
MASPGKLEVEMEIKSPTDKFWESIRSSTTLFPKVLSDYYERIEVVEGDGKSEGSVRLVKYTSTGGIPVITMSKERIDLVDEANKVEAYSAIEGDILKFYKHFRARVHVTTAGGDDKKKVVKWSCEFDKASDEVPDPHLVQDFATKTLKALDDYLVNNA